MHKIFVFAALLMTTPAMADGVTVTVHSHTRTPDAEQPARGGGVEYRSNGNTASDRRTNSSSFGWVDPCGNRKGNSSFGFVQGSINCDSWGNWNPPDDHRHRRK